MQMAPPLPGRVLHKERIGLPEAPRNGIPKGLRRQVMFVNHKSVFNSHLGVKKTEVGILLNFFWP